MFTYGDHHGGDLTHPPLVHPYLAGRCFFGSQLVIETEARLLLKY